VRRSAFQRAIAADGGRCDPEPPRLKAHVSQTTGPDLKAFKTFEQLVA
jgi:hypothetical protein